MRPEIIGQGSLIKATSCIKNAEDKLFRNNVFTVKLKTQISAKGRVEKE